MAALAAAYWGATSFGSPTAEATAQLIYKGLPMPPGPRVYEPPTLTTYREIAFSNPLMQKVTDHFGLAVPASEMPKFYECAVTQNSSILRFSINWGDEQDAIAILNYTLGLLIDQARTDRVSLLRAHMTHYQQQQAAAQQEAVRTLEQLHAARQREAEEMSSGNLVNSMHNSTVQLAIASQAAMDGKRVEMMGIDEQVAELDTRIFELTNQLMLQLIGTAKNEIENKGARYTQGSRRWEEVQSVREALDDMADRIADGHPSDRSSYSEWKAEFVQLISPEVDPGLVATDDVRTQEALIRQTTEGRAALALSRIPITKQVELFEQQRLKYEQNAVKLAGSVTATAANDVLDLEAKLQRTQSKLAGIESQLENMRQLVECDTPEFEVFIPASEDTTELGSNKKKLFVLIFALASVLMATPIVGYEALQQRDAPVTAFANRFSIPVIAERMLKNFQTPSLSREVAVDDDVRMLALRIQQTVGKPNGVIMFTSLGETPPPVALISSLAECLANREERVLLIDAVDPVRNNSLLAVTPSAGRGDMLLLGESQGQEPEEPTPENSSPRFGLSDFLSRECEGVQSLIQPTLCPGVDLISRGNAAFPREAMASSCMTELLNHCRHAYTKVLVVGPGASSLADVEMLAARSDGVVLTADDDSLKSPRAATAVRELVELQAPLIGIVS
ncbi:hypothetical protein [Posidoniimonas polymericola]|uniref:hypothetical protein n=1 Tax=Posidoniimonas polymericola TaxID=2528002 RepID=UPI0011B682B9|nr:hypothetical protein [Posidoniimonas polymericola]